MPQRTAGYSVLPWSITSCIRLHRHFHVLDCRQFQLLAAHKESLRFAQPLLRSTGNTIQGLRQDHNLMLMCCTHKCATVIHRTSNVPGLMGQSFLGLIWIWALSCVAMGCHSSRTDPCYFWLRRRLLLRFQICNFQVCKSLRV